MSLWRSQLGPHYDGDARRLDETGRPLRCIVEIVCPDCNNTLGRVHDESHGVGLSVWVPATGQAPSDPGSQRVGWSLYALLSDDSVSDEEGAVLKCWRGHDSLWITAGECRASVTRYRAQGRKVRQLAGRLPDDADTLDDN